MENEPSKGAWICKGGHRGEDLLVGVITRIRLQNEGISVHLLGQGHFGEKLDQFVAVISACPVG